MDGQGAMTYACSRARHLGGGANGELRIRYFAFNHGGYLQLFSLTDTGLLYADLILGVEIVSGQIHELVAKIGLVTAPNSE